MLVSCCTCDPEIRDCIAYLYSFPVFDVMIHCVLFSDVHVLLQMELKLRLMELNWQKSQCVKVITADGRTRSEVRVGGHLFIFTPSHHEVQS